MTKRYQNPDWLERKYWEEGLTQREMAEICGVSPTTIRTYMKEFGIERRDLEGENHPLYGEERDEAVRESISESLSGREFSPETLEKMSESQTGFELPDETKEKISESLQGTSKSDETRRKMSESSRGEDNPRWRGGRENTYGPEWPSARRRVRQRDEVCQQCGADGSDSILDVHHIEPVAHFRNDPDHSLADAHRLENLVLLCRQCHMSVEYENHGSM